MKPRYLTKTRFKLASECPRKLFYCADEKTYPNTKRENDFLLALAEGGHQVGTLAQCYFPDGHVISTLDYDEAVAQTNELLQRSDVVIYEAAIRHVDYFIRVDVLVKRGNDIELIEVKAKSYAPDETTFTNKRNPAMINKDWLPYLDDVAFQTWVTRQARPDWRVRPFLMLVDKSRTADVDGLHQLFRISRGSGRTEVVLTAVPTAERVGRQLLAEVDVLTEVESLIAGGAVDAAKDPLNARPLSQRAEQYAAIYGSGDRFTADLGAHCKKCEYRASDAELAEGKLSGYLECWREHHGPEFDHHQPHIFDIWNARNLESWLDEGVYRMEDVPASDLNDRQTLQVEVTLGRQAESEVIAPQLFAEMRQWQFPLHFVDFETIMPAIPFHAGMHPYQNLAFQFSCHHLGADGRLTHDQWLSADAGTFPNWDFLVELRKALGDSGTIFRYAMHENTILNHLKAQLNSGCRPVPASLDVADYSNWVERITKDGDRAMVDMCQLVRDYYYHARMRGSNSIKAVLPAVLEASKRLEDTYAKPLEFGTNLRGFRLWQRDGDTGAVKDPYKLLPPLFADIDPDVIEFLDAEDEIREGGAAMTAWARMQFCEMSPEEHRAISEGLLRYCELDTLAMVMIYQHWESQC